MSSPKYKPATDLPASSSPIEAVAKTVASFSVKYVQFLDEDGRLAEDAPPFAQDNELLLSLFRVMKTLQLFDRKVLMLHRSGKMGTYTGTLGQEAVGAGAASGLHDSDVFVPYYRSTTDLYVRGVKLHEILLYWGGDERGSDFQDPRMKNDLPIPICIGSQLLHAAGVATAIKLREQTNRAVLTMVGDGGTSQGDFYEALNVAGAWQLPLVIVINNNQWALSEPNRKQTACQTLAQKAVAGGIEGVQVDGNDIVAVRAVTEAALRKAREGGGATLIEAITYRLCSHTTIDNMERYVDAREHQQAQKKEPLIRLRKLLQSRNVLNESIEERMEYEIKEEIEREVEIFLNTPLQPPEAMFDYLYAELPEKLQAQREEVIKREFK
ncbi:MAG TPA: pyruvate dehydrogenase (acetyl-transferring) E1 component subunit alpha [Gammaproteobacteria bacterium]